MTIFQQLRAKFDKDNSERPRKVQSVVRRMEGQECPNCHVSNWGVAMSYPNNDLMAEPKYHAYCHKCGWSEKTGKVRDRTQEQPKRPTTSGTWGT